MLITGVKDADHRVGGALRYGSVHGGSWAGASGHGGGHPGPSEGGGGLWQAPGGVERPWRRQDRGDGRGGCRRTGAVAHLPWGGAAGLGRSGGPGARVK